MIQLLRDGSGSQKHWCFLLLRDVLETSWQHDALVHPRFPVSLLTEPTEEVSLDSPEREVLLSDGPSPAITPISPPTSVITPRIMLAHDDMFTHSPFDEVTKVWRSRLDIDSIRGGLSHKMGKKFTLQTWAAFD